MSALDRVLFNLSALADIPRGCRIDSSREYISVDRSYFPSFTRMIRENGRKQTAERISADVGIATEFAMLMMENPSAHLNGLRNILSSLRAASIGIKNLRDTYAGCTIFAGTIGPVADRVISAETMIVKCLRELGEY